MANPMMIAQILGTGLQVAGAFQQARGVQEQTAFDIYQLQLKTKQDLLNAEQQQIQRIAELDANEKINRAVFFSGLNRDPSDRSLKAFFAKQREIASKDVNAINNQTTMMASQAKLQETALQRQSKSAYQAALLGAGSAVTSGYMRYQEYKTDGLFD
jgi:hypothetical protein